MCSINSPHTLFSANVGREDIFKPTVGNESLHEYSSDNGVRGVNFAMYKNVTVKGTLFPYNIRKYTWTSSDGESHVQVHHILIDRRGHSNVLDIRSLKAAGYDIDHCLVVTEVRERLAVNNKDHAYFILRGLISRI
jgi:hypothetical protein